nr:hypothetical protein [Chitinophagaceae bacterium]
ISRVLGQLLPIILYQIIDNILQKRSNHGHLVCCIEPMVIGSMQLLAIALLETFQTSLAHFLFSLVFSPA